MLGLVRQSPEYGAGPMCAFTARGKILMLSPNRRTSGYWFGVPRAYIVLTCATLHSHAMPATFAVLLFALTSASVTAGEWERPFVDEPSGLGSDVEEKDRAWKEGSWSLPDWPAEANLVEFVVEDPSARFRQYIDKASLEVGSDGAVRYTLVVESASGARNVSFEGLRCTPGGEYRVYAFGHEGRFKTAVGDWVSLRGRQHDEIHLQLHRILCVPLKFEPRPRKDILRVMRSRVPLEANTGFMAD